jgi:hypothetical protein
METPSEILQRLKDEEYIRQYEIWCHWEKVCMSQETFDKFNKLYPIHKPIKKNEATDQQKAIHKQMQYRNCAYKRKCKNRNEKNQCTDTTKLFCGFKEEDYFDNKSQTTAKRYNAGKPRYSLIDYASLESLVRVLEFGEAKYGRDNWKLGLSKESVMDSLIRHIAKLNDGEELDSESNLPHIGHAMCNLMFLEYYKRNEKQGE